GTYSPQLDGTLVKISIILQGQAASSLCSDARVELSQTNWTPNVLRFPISGFGINTALNPSTGVNMQTDFVVNQPVKTSQPITGNHVEPGTGPVTPLLIVTGYFTA